MASVQQVITDRLAAYQISLSDARLAALLVDSSLNSGDPYSSTNSVSVKGAMVTVLAELLAMPDITEGGMSIKWDRGAVSRYLAQLQSELGQVVAGQPTVTEKSYLW